jgi:acetyl-CoA carboxylase carboxyltransferase component
MARLGTSDLLRLLVDAETFQKLSPEVPPASFDGVVTGKAMINGRPVVVFAQDPTFRGGSIGMAAEPGCKMGLPL